MSIQNKSEDCPLCNLTETNQPRSGNDMLWEAIPFYDLLEEATAHCEECGARTESDIINCAEKVVRSRICTCCLGEDTIVNAIVKEFVDKLKAASKQK